MKMKFSTTCFLLLALAALCVDAQDTAALEAELEADQPEEVAPKLPPEGKGDTQGETIEITATPDEKPEIEQETQLVVVPPPTEQGGETSETAMAEGAPESLAKRQAGCPATCPNYIVPEHGSWEFNLGCSGTGNWEYTRNGQRLCPCQVPQRLHKRMPANYLNPNYNGRTVYWTASSYKKPQCQLIDTQRVTEQQKQEIVNLHNHYRYQVQSGGSGQPKATNMGALVWNDTLADQALLWAQQCDWNHYVPKGSIGQNMGATAKILERNGTRVGPLENPYSVNFTKAISNWYKEKENMLPSIVNSFQSRKKPNVVGHYTQTVWAITKSVGCGYAVISPCNFMEDNPPSCTIYVCNYYPRGNTGGCPVYKT